MMLNSTHKRLDEVTIYQFTCWYCGRPATRNKLLRYKLKDYILAKSCTFFDVAAAVCSKCNAFSLLTFYNGVLEPFPKPQIRLAAFRKMSQTDKILADYYNDIRLSFAVAFSRPNGSYERVAEGCRNMIEGLARYWCKLQGEKFNKRETNSRGKCVDLLCNQKALPGLFRYILRGDVIELGNFATHFQRRISEREAIFLMSVLDLAMNVVYVSNIDTNVRNLNSSAGIDFMFALVALKKQGGSMYELDNLFDSSKANRLNSVLSDSPLFTELKNSRASKGEFLIRKFPLAMNDPRIEDLNKNIVGIIRD